MLTWPNKATTSTDYMIFVGMSKLEFVEPEAFCNKTVVCRVAKVTLRYLLHIRQLEINFPFIKIKLVPYFGVDGFVALMTIFRSLLFVEQVFQFV